MLVAAAVPYLLGASPKQVILCAASPGVCAAIRKKDIVACKNKDKSPAYAAKFGTAQLYSLGILLPFKG